MPDHTPHLAGWSRHEDAQGYKRHDGWIVGYAHGQIAAWNDGQHRFVPALPGMALEGLMAYVDARYPGEACDA